MPIKTLRMYCYNVLHKVPRLRILVNKVHCGVLSIINLHSYRELSKEYQERLSGLNHGGKKIWYLCVPCNNNLGDHAQYFCIKKWCKENFPEYGLIEIPARLLMNKRGAVFRLVKELVDKDDIIIFQSGYTSTDISIDERVHRNVAGEFIENRIVFFPQTVKYYWKSEARRTAREYNRHGRILFLARDEESFRIAKDLFYNIQVEICPDVVTSLIGSDEFDSQCARKGIMLCLRSDSEKAYSDAEIENSVKGLAHYGLDKSDTQVGIGRACDKDSITEYINKLAKYRLVITDRFHGTIFSLVAKTPVLVIKTADHKVVEGAKWFTGIVPDFVHLVDNLEGVESIAETVLDSNANATIPAYWKETYFDRLARKIELL